MKAHEALIAWSGWDDESAMRGQVAVGRMVGEGQVAWTNGYSNKGGAVLVQARRKMRGAQSLAGVFRDFHYLVVDERLDPELVHRAFLAIDEYADLFG
ncbi:MULTISPECIES: hypothetical protein [unclassified Mesorhizobium]|uniref:hypothetical protein n=1 Tax=unclassified Mesorhizobium TaxID=325217 RepID=UPI000F76587D|nr:MULTISPECIES: hypothetical protein [unclassified Mesorhizobium]AZO56820.1 hypothetical protein EJ077_28000 [Mesorhizobium sp. M8A.F.Ca.ET.057.01.1.1]RWE49183.1 MAG: hypothetical protein EOS80_06725 [Mesorhizobium sp.]TJX73323.1 MAG: hypothetical protein E5W21_06035 [Mesorhizobium sp.]